MRAAPTSIRIAWAGLFALLLALRSLAPAGFMPAFDHGTVTIVACPGAQGAPAMPTHRHEGKSFHEPCPYAAASALAAVAADWPPFLAVMLFASLVLAIRPTPAIAIRAARERPPSRGPPLPA